MRVIADGLLFPEGPVCLSDGSFLVVELRRQTLTHVGRDGRKSVVAKFDGVPNGAAIGPDGAVYICNNGGMKWREHGRYVLPYAQSDDYSGGRIERVDLATGKVERLYDRCGEFGLRGPNDLVFDAQGGFWFTDIGKRRARDTDRGGLYYAKADGSMIREVVYPVVTPNGVGLSPDGRTVYECETDTGRVWGWEIKGPGELAEGVHFPESPNGGRLLYARYPFGGFDSMAVEANGNICAAAVGIGGIAVVAPQGGLVEFIPIEDAFVTNLAFGGPDLRKACLTFSGFGQLVEMDWPRPGLKLNYQDRA